MEQRSAWWLSDTDTSRRSNRSNQLGLPSVEFAYSPCVCIGLLLLLQFLPSDCELVCLSVCVSPVVDWYPTSHPLSPLVSLHSGCKIGLSNLAHSEPQSCRFSNLPCCSQETGILGEANNYMAMTRLQTPHIREWMDYGQRKSSVFNPLWVKVQISAFISNFWELS